MRLIHSLDMRYKQKRYNKCLMYGNIWYAHKIVCPSNNEEIPMSKPEKPFIALNIAILTVSDTRSLEEDTSGQ